MGRAAAMMLVLCGLIASGWGFVQHHKAHPKQAPINTAAGQLAAAELKDAGDQLYLTKRWADTYDGPDLKNFKDLKLVRASDTSFCLEVAKEGYVFRLIGPGGVAEPGTCQ
jgi:hypothetical protein